MQTTTNYGLKKPEVTEFYDVQVNNDNMDAIDAKMKEIENAAGGSQALTEHIEDTDNPHSVTKAQVGLSNVPNVSTNNQTPTYAVPDTATALESGEKLSVAMGKIAKVVSDYLNTVTATLTAGATTLTLTSDRITTDSRFDFYTSIYGVSPTNVAVAAGSITLTFDAQETDMNVEVRVM